MVDNNLFLQNLPECGNVIALSGRTIPAERSLGVTERGFCIGIALRVELLLEDAWLLHLIGNKAPSVARDSSEVARA